MEQSIERTNRTYQSQNYQNISDELWAQVSCSIVMPSDESYEAARRVFNGAVSYRPAIIALCESTEDVQAAVSVARRYNLPFSVRGGGHDWAGRGIVPRWTRGRPHQDEASSRGTRTRESQQSQEVQISRKWRWLQTLTA
jgi:hypothetical protein